MTIFLLCAYHLGIATTTVTLHALLALMTTRQDVQEKLHQEILHKIGSRNPSIADRKEMPYFTAVSNSNVL